MPHIHIRLQLALTHSTSYTANKFSLLQPLTPCLIPPPTHTNTHTSMVYTAILLITYIHTYNCCNPMKEGAYTTIWDNQRVGLEERINN